MKKYLLIVSLSMFLLSCSEQAPSNKSEETAKVENLNVDNLYSEIDNLIDKEIVVSGTVDHVCKHSGKRAFIFSEDENTRIKIEAGDKIRGFDADLIGNDIKVTGIVRETRYDDAYINKVEDDLEKMDHHAIGEENEEKYKTQKEQIEKLKEEISQSEKGYKSVYYIDGIKFEKIENK